MAAPFQFLIHFIKQDVSQSWLQRSALQRALVPRLHHALFQDAAVQIGSNQPDHAGSSIRFYERPIGISWLTLSKL